MSSTAFDGQFAPEPVAPVRERYDTATILRRNIADLEIALRKQVERAEAAEAELEAVREDNHAMMLEIDGMRTERAIQAERDFESLISDDNTIQEYAYELGGTDSGEYHLTAQDVARIAAKASEPYTSALRSLASYVGAGGYNADAVDAGVFEDKIRWGIGEIIARMEKVEAELAKLREQEPVAYVKYKATGGNVGLSWLAVPTGAFYPREGEQLYAAPIPAPAAPAPVPDGDDFDGDTPHMIRSIEALVDMSDRGKLIPHGLCGNARKLLLASANRLRQQVMPVPEEWREVMEILLDTFERCEAGFHPHVEIRYAVRDQARALLQSADHSERNLEKVAPDCRNCANRGRVNGLSQESYCDGCVYQGRSWRKNHFVLAVKRRCEACAILPCSCK